jgi:tRNA-binding protein
MDKPPIVYDDFAKVDMRVGRIVSVKPFERARNPSYKVEVDFGPLGRKWSSAQITSYPEAELVGRLVVCVVNMPPRNIAGFQSEVLILGAKNARSEIILLSPLAEVSLGEQVF